jgi:hypothetical protein
MIEIYHRIVGRKREGEGVFILGRGSPESLRPPRSGLRHSAEATT